MGAEVTCSNGIVSSNRWRGAWFRTGSIPPPVGGAGRVVLHLAINSFRCLFLWATAGYQCPLPPRGPLTDNRDGTGCTKEGEADHGGLEKEQNAHAYKTEAPNEIGPKVGAMSRPLLSCLPKRDREE